LKLTLGRMLLSALIAFLGIVAGKPIVELATGPAAAKIDGPVAAPLRSIVMLDASESNGQKFDWFVSAGVPYAVCHNGQCLALFTGDKPAYAVVRLVVQSARGGKLTESSADHTIAIGGAPPPNPSPPGPTPPGPQPGPQPGPVPDGFKGLSKIAYEAVMQHVAPSNTRRAEAQALAKALHDVAKDCGPNGKYSTYLEAGSATLRAKAALGDARPKWEEALKAIQKQVGTLLTTATPIDEIGKAIDAVADGLDRVP
jgi:hypothetical protein